MKVLMALAIAALALPAAARAQLADPARGEEIFDECSGCHSIEAGTNRYGPSLHAVVGRRSGAIGDFDYSDAMRASRLVWTEAMLDRWLANPRALVPGTRMDFPGMPQRQDRRDVIAYLETAGSAP
ncbi:c-type cytochrome [Inquilinus sp.]|uniref:c-type cytochrome n=1 Tax=Inquilinus sp. TaxID=1932117 RepID=UPI003783E4CE